MYPQTMFEWDDQSALKHSIDKEAIVINELLASSTDKGPEDMRYVSGEMFTKLYGDYSKRNAFAKHGQPLIQALNVVNTPGGGLLFKRLVARDATLANLAVLAKVKKVQTQKTNAEGALLYYDSIGNEVTDNTEGNEPVMETSVRITYQCEAVVNSQNLQEEIDTIKEKILDIDEDNNPEGLESVFPLFIIADNGRGESKKRIRISPKHTASKAKPVMKYSFEVIEYNEILETLEFTLDHNYIDQFTNTNRSLQTVIKSNSNQVTCHLFEDYFDAFFDKVAEISGYDVELLRESDLFFGFDKADGRTPLEGINVDLDNGFNLSFVYGLDLTEGKNGSFGNYPFGTEEWNECALEFFDGSFTPQIYDLYNAQFDVVVDANYPDPVKSAIEALAIFREDFCYFRDSGIGLTSLDELIAKNENNARSKFIIPYVLSYNVLEEISRKEITVTIGYNLAKILVTHFKNGRNLPLAGSLHEFVIPEAIENTLNFLPSKTPAVDEKAELEDAGLNYGSYYNGMLTIETFWNTYDKKTELSYAHNILAMQEVMKAVRNRCPQIRYPLLTKNDLTNYEKDVNAVLNKFANNFEDIKLEYAEDASMLEQKVYYAIINFVTKNFIYAEKFKLRALPVGTVLK